MLGLRSRRLSVSGCVSTCLVFLFDDFYFRFEVRFCFVFGFGFCSVVLLARRRPYGYLWGFLGWLVEWQRTEVMASGRVDAG